MCQILVFLALVYQQIYAAEMGQSGSSSISSSIKWGQSSQTPSVLSSSGILADDRMKDGSQRLLFNNDDYLKITPQDLISQPQKEPLNIIQVLSTKTKLLAKNTYKQPNCRVTGKRAGIYSCSTSEACSSSMMMELRNTILDDCLIGIFPTKRSGNQCACCTKIENFIKKYSMNTFLLCACSKQLLCEELGTVAQLAHPFARFQTCGITIQNQPTC